MATHCSREATVHGKLRAVRFHARRAVLARRAWLSLGGTSRILISFSIIILLLVTRLLVTGYSCSLGSEHLDVREGMLTGVGGSTRLISLRSTAAEDFQAVQRNCGWVNTSMKANRARLCALFPWLFKTLEMNTPKDVRSGTKMIELRGLGEVANYERIGLSYTSLRDVMAAQKRRRTTLTTELGDGHWSSDNYPRTPKSRLLEKAAHAWLQPTVCDRRFQHRNFFSMYWLRNLGRPNQPTAATLPVAPHRSAASLSSCIVFLPFLKWFDLSPRVERLGEPPTST
ncbi:unnamed protein product [Calypogeia fissa]